MRQQRPTPVVSFHSQHSCLILTPETLQCRAYYTARMNPLSVLTANALQTFASNNKGEAKRTIYSSYGLERQYPRCYVIHTSEFHQWHIFWCVN